MFSVSENRTMDIFDSRLARFTDAVTRGGEQDKALRTVDLPPLLGP